MYPHCSRIFHSYLARCKRGTNEALQTTARGSDYSNVMTTWRLNGRPASVTDSVSPLPKSSLNGFSRFSRVAASSCGGAWRYSGFGPNEREGFLINLQRHLSGCGREAETYRSSRSRR